MYKCYLWAIFNHIPLPMLTLTVFLLRESHLTVVLMGDLLLAACSIISLLCGIEILTISQCFR